LVNLIRRAVEAASDENGWAQLSAVGTNIAKQSPEFDPRNYGYTKLGEVVKATQLFEIEKRETADNHSKVIYIRDQRKKQRENKQPDPEFIEQWKRFIHRYKEGDILDGTIENITYMGLFVTLQNQAIKGLIHKSNLPDDYITHFTVGQIIPVIIKAIRTEKCQIELLRDDS